MAYKRQAMPTGSSVESSAVAHRVGVAGEFFGRVERGDVAAVLPALLPPGEDHGGAGPAAELADSEREVLHCAVVLVPRAQVVNLAAV